MCVGSARAMHRQGAHRMYGHRLIALLFYEFRGVCAHRKCRNEEPSWDDPESPAGQMRQGEQLFCTQTRTCGRFSRVDHDTMSLWEEGVSMLLPLYTVPFCCCPPENYQWLISSANLSLSTKTPFIVRGLFRERFATL